jgi:hypothetical protein
MGLLLTFSGSAPPSFCPDADFFRACKRDAPQLAEAAVGCFDAGR